MVASLPEVPLRQSVPSFRFTRFVSLGFLVLQLLSIHFLRVLIQPQQEKF
jgi:hypothetical protein